MLLINIPMPQIYSVKMPIEENIWKDKMKLRNLLLI